MGGFEEGPKFEKPVPWDESVIPPEKREYLLKLYKDPEEVERFWSDEELGKNLENREFQEMIDEGFFAIVLEHPDIFIQRENIEEFNKRNDDFERNVARIVESADPKKGKPFRQPEIFRQWFALNMKFMMDEGVPKDRFDLAPFLGRAYELEAERYRDHGIPVGDSEHSDIYPFEKPRNEVVGKKIRHKARKKKTEDKHIYNEDLPPGEKGLAEAGEEYLKRHAGPELKRRLLQFAEPGSKERLEAHRDFERRYQERKVEENKKKNKE